MKMLIRCHGGSSIYESFSVIEMGAEPIIFQAHWKENNPNVTAAVSQPEICILIIQIHETLSLSLAKHFTGIS